MQKNGKYEIGPILEFLQARAGLSFGPRRAHHVKSGIDRAMERIGISDFEAYQKLVASRIEIADDLIDELTVGETYFFREPEHFELIRQTILPDLLRRRGPTHRPRVWSAGCASGEETYTLAMVFAEEGILGRSHLFGTDISRRALAKAHQAVYTSWSLRHTRGSGQAARYLRRAGKTFSLDPTLRKGVTFKYHNLALDTYPSLTSEIWGLDLILCRNVFIYFDRDTIRSVARRLYASLASGGWLITGPSDPMLDQHAPWETVTTQQGLFYRRNAEALPIGLAKIGLPKIGLPKIGLPKIGLPKIELPRVSPSSPVLRPEEPPRNPKADPDIRTNTTDPDVVTQARAALTAGDYARVAELREALCQTAAGCALWVRALANLEGSGAAELAVSSIIAGHSRSSELHFLHTVLLTDLGRDEDAAEAVRRTLYLDRSLAVAHFFAGTIRQRRGDPAGARRAYRNAHELCAAQPADTEVPLADGELAGRLAAAARAQMTLLGATRGDTVPPGGSRGGDQA